MRDELRHLVAVADVLETPNAEAGGGRSVIEG